LEKGNFPILIIALATMPLALVLTYCLQMTFTQQLPYGYSLPIQEIPFMILGYFIGAIPEEIGWSTTLTNPLAQKHRVIFAGLIIGSVWALWHIIPWSWTHSTRWIGGMVLLNIMMRILMTYLFIKSRGSLLCAVLFHAMINTSFGQWLPGRHLDGLY
jgi:uncharacterized protein